MYFMLGVFEIMIESQHIALPSLLSGLGNSYCTHIYSTRLRAFIPWADRVMRGKSVECVWVLRAEERSRRGGPEGHGERHCRYAGRHLGCAIAGLLSYCREPEHRSLDPSHSGVCSMTVSRVMRVCTQETVGSI